MTNHITSHRRNALDAIARGIETLTATNGNTKYIGSLRNIARKIETGAPTADALATIVLANLGK